MSKQPFRFSARSLASYIDRKGVACTPDQVLAEARRLGIGSPGKHRNSPLRLTEAEGNTLANAIVQARTTEMQNQIARVQDKTRNLRASTLNIYRHFSLLAGLAEIHGHKCAAGLKKLGPILRGSEKLEIPNASMNKADFIKAETAWARLDKAAHAIFESEVEPFLDPEPQAAPDPTGPRPAAGAHTRYNFICHMQRRGSWEKEDRRVSVQASNLQEAGREVETRCAQIWPEWQLQSYSYDGRS